MEMKRFCLMSVVLMILFAVAGCGKGGDGGSGSRGNEQSGPNAAPLIISAPERFAKTDLLYEYQVLAVDPDGDRLSYQLVVGPDGMTLDETTGLLRWPFPASHGVSHSVELSVMDGESAIKQSFDITVERKEVIAERLILAQEGGVLEVTDPANAFWGLSVEIPPGALAENSTILVFDINDPNYLPTGSHAIEIIAHSTTGSISPSAEISARKIRSAAESPGIRIRITYTDQWLQTNNLQKNQLGIYREHIIAGPVCDTIAFDPVNCSPQPPTGSVPGPKVKYTYVKIDNATHESQLNSFTFNVDSLSSLGSRYFVGTDGLKSAVGPRYFEIVKGEIASFREDQSTSLILLHGVCASSDHFRGPDDWKEFFRKYHYKNILFFNYPWQERVVDNANALIQLVKVLGLNDTAKFDIIAHSMGGMVSRAAIEGSEQYNIRNQVGHLFMVGTPNFGVPEPGLEEMLFRLGCGVKATKAAGTRDLIKELSIFLPDINRPGISSRRSGAYHLYTAKTSHFDACTGVTLITDPTRCAGHDDRDGDRWSDHINVFGLTTPIDFVPVPNEVELNQLGFDSAKTFDGPNYDHSTLHTDCARNGVCEEVLRRVTGQPPVTTTPPPIFTLNISPGGTGSGTVSGTGISCPGDCSQTHSSGTNVTLTASANIGSIFGGWSGCTSVSGTTCSVTMDADKIVTPTFNAVEPPPTDTTPPDTLIDSGPSASTTLTSASFTFHATEGGSSFECKLDAGSFTACISPKTFSDLAVGSHTFSVRATDAAGNTDSAAATYAWWVKEAIPSAPTGVTTVAGDGQVTISWNAVNGATSYNLYWYVSTPVTKTTAFKIDGATSPFIHSGLTNSTTYFYVVTALNATGESEESIELSSMPSATSGIPSTPTSVQARAGDSEVTISWNAVNGATSYNIYWNTITPVTKATGFKVPNVTNPFLHVGRTNGVIYYYIVTAENANGESAASAQVAARPPSAIQGRSIGIGYNHTCAVVLDGTVQCWGSNEAGELGNGSNINSSTPVTVTDLSDVIAVTSGISHTCALLSGGTVKCWGIGWLGNGTVEGLPTVSNTPVTVTGLNDVIAVSAGAQHTCALLSGGAAKCWGYNPDGQLGDGTTTTRITPVTVVGLSSVTAIAAGDLHTCALLLDGTVKCWGSNAEGRLGDGTTSTRHTPVAVAGLNAISISAGSHTCAILSDGTAQCWGGNFAGQLGDGTTTNHSTPVTVADLSGVTAIAAGNGHTCAVLSNGTVKCWGNNERGQLGDGTMINRLTPAAVIGISNARAIGGRYHSCALSSDGTVNCWGENMFGQLGDGVAIMRTTPTTVSSLNSATVIVAGDGHNCAVLLNAAAQCWGYNGFGILGDTAFGNTLINRSTPVDVISLHELLTIAAGSVHTCALISGGTVKCWGVNTFGALGDGTTTERSTPVTVTGLSGVTAISAGGSHTCALLGDGTVRCWGWNSSGQLGDGTKSNRTGPVTVTGLSGVTAISAGDSYTCALITDGTIKCWGINSNGQLGDGTTIERLVPTLTSGINSAISIDTKRYNTCALISGGTVMCWGDNSLGQLGQGGITNSKIPIMVTGLSSAISVAVGGLHTCSIVTGGIVKCWGSNQYGQLGDGRSMYSLTPVGVVGLGS